MGPRPEGHGETTRISIRLREKNWLQWGHVQKDMESSKIIGTQEIITSASMGPRPEGHGEAKGSPRGGGKNHELQWGHVQKDMES